MDDFDHDKEGSSLRVIRRLSTYMSGWSRVLESDGGVQGSPVPKLVEAFECDVLRGLVRLAARCLDAGLPEAHGIELADRGSKPWPK